MSATGKTRMLRTLQYVFIGLMLLCGFLLIKHISEYFGITGDGPIINGWVTMVTEQEPEGTPHPDSTKNMTLFHSGDHKLITIEFADMGLLFKEKYLVYVISHIVAWVLLILVLYQMHRILRNIEKGHIFQDSNVRRIRRIALAIFIIPLLLYASGWILAGITYTFYGHQYVTDMPDLHRERVVIGSLAALLVFALGEIFRTGIQLKQDHDMTP